MKPRISSIIPALAAAFTISYAHAADFTWNGATDNWTSANWNPGPVAGPTASTDTATINSGIVTLSPGSTIDSAITLVSGGTLNLDTAGGNITLNGNLSSSGALNKNGNFSLFLSGDNSGFSGTATCNQSNIFFTTDNSGSAQADWVLNAGSFSWLTTGNHTVKLGSLAGTGGILGHNLGSGSGQLTFEIGAKGGNTTFSGGIIDTQWAAGTTAISKVGSGTLTLTNANSYSGGTTVDNGTLELSGSTGGTGRIRGVLTVNSGGTVNVTGGDGTGFGYNVGQGLSNLNIVGGTVTGTGSNHLLDTAINMTGGSLALSGGSYQMLFSPLNSLASASTATISGNLSIRSDFGNNPLNVTVADGAAATDMLISGNIGQSSSGGILNKSGAGKAVLSGINSYDGNTNVLNGTLELADNSQLKFSVTDSAATLVTGAGTATFNGDFNIDTTAVSGTTDDFWQLVDVNSLFGESFGSTFTVIGFVDPENDGVWTKTDSKGTWEFSEEFGDLTLVIGSDYVAWKTANGVTGGENDDDDNDGVTNREEYAFGLDPTGGSSVNPITSPLNKSTGKFSYTRRKLSLPVPPLIYTIWYSTDLSVWTKDTGATEGTPVLVGEVETVEVTVSPALLTNPKLFIQVRAN